MPLGLVVYATSVTDVDVLECASVGTPRACATLTVVSNMTTSNTRKMNCNPCVHGVAPIILMKPQVVNEEPAGLKVEMLMLVMLRLIVKLHHFLLLS